MLRLDIKWLFYCHLIINIVLDCLVIDSGELESIATADSIPNRFHNSEEQSILTPNPTKIESIPESE